MPYDYFQYWTCERFKRGQWRSKRQKGRSEYVDILNRYIRGKYSSVLDVGCGSGRYIRSFPSFCGVDINRDRLEGAKRSMVVRGDLLQLPFQPKMFQAAYTVQVLMHIPENLIRHSLRELVRVTRERILHIELFQEEQGRLASHCFNHNLKKLYKALSVEEIFSKRLDSYTSQVCSVFELKSCP